MSKELLTKAEHALVEKIGSAFDDFVDICGNGGSREHDLEEAINLIHGLQNMVLAQAAARAYPKTYRLMGKVIR